MSKAKLVVAILINVFLMPGGGHFLIKRKVRGAIYFFVVLAVLFIFSFHVAVILKDNMPMIKKGQMDLVQMVNFTTALTTDILIEYAFIIKVYVFILGLCYIVSIADLCWIYFDERDRGTTRV